MNADEYFKEHYKHPEIQMVAKESAIHFAEAYLKHKTKSQKSTISDVSDCLSIKQVAVRYGQKVKCKWLTPDGNDWLDKEMIVNAHFLKEMEQGSIKDCR